MHAFRLAAASLSAATLLLAASVSASFAATTSPYTASFPQERTIQRTCPAGVPQGAFCFTGSDHSRLGNSIPPGATATEDFAGYVDFSHPIANACTAIPGSPSSTIGFPDHNVVTIATTSGLLFLRTDGVDCQSTGTDDGTWQVLGGTGMFSGAAGSGHVHTQATGGTGSQSDPIRSFSSYTGNIRLR